MRTIQYIHSVITESFETDFGELRSLITSPVVDHVELKKLTDRIPRAKLNDIVLPYMKGVFSRKVNKASMDAALSMIASQCADVLEALAKGIVLAQSPPNKSEAKRILDAQLENIAMDMMARGISAQEAKVAAKRIRIDRFIEIHQYADSNRNVAMRRLNKVVFGSRTRSSEDYFSTPLGYADARDFFTDLYAGVLDGALKVEGYRPSKISIDGSAVERNIKENYKSMMA